MKNIKKQLGYGVLMWLIIFVSMSIIGFTPALATMSDAGFELNAWGYTAHFIVLTVLVWVLTNMYFKSVKKGKFEDGIKAGAVIVLTGVLLDIIITIPLFVKDYALYFSDYLLWAGILYAILLFGIFASVERNK